MIDLMNDPETLSATEASRSFSEVLHRVCYGGESFIIKKGNRMMARIVPMVEAETEPEIAAPAAAQEVSESEIETPSLPVTGDEAEFYQAWMEQVRKVEA